MESDVLIWIIKAYGPGTEQVYWAFSPGEAISILEEIRNSQDEYTISMELTTNPN
jgi:hypothetical protein